GARPPARAAEREPGSTRGRPSPHPAARPGEAPPATGEPAIVLKVRAQFARWAAVSGGLLMINLATGIDHPWFLVPAAWLGIGLLTGYGKLWQAGYSWRDVLRRPPAPDAVETAMVKGGRLPRQLPSPKPEEFGAHHAAIAQAHADRAAIYKLLDRLPPSEREMIPEIPPTVDALYQRATDLARTLQVMDSGLLDAGGLAQLEERIAAVSREPDDAERARRLALLEKQRQTLKDLEERRAQVAAHLESCVLAIQNVRFDLLRLRSAGIAAVLGDLTQATQQAKALSRDVDHAIEAAREVGEAVRAR